MSTDRLVLDRPDPHVRRITMNRPDQLNAMDVELCEALHAELQDCAADRTCRAIVLTGAGRGFCAGLDLTGYGVPPGAPEEDRARFTMAVQQHLSKLILRLRDTPQPIVAAINGPAAGIGLALGLGSDVRYAARSAVLRAAFINIGVSNCDMGTSWLLPRLIGASRAHELMLTGRRVGAEEAERIGLVAAVVDDDALADHALDAARAIAALAPWGVRLTKQGMWTALEIPSERAAVELEDRQQAIAGQSPAVNEAIAAFLEKRPANFAD